MMNKMRLHHPAALVLLAIGFSFTVRSQEKADTPSRLTVPWEEFKKISRIDENEIILPLETFNKLVAQTGVKTEPPHTLREGLVVMNRASFQQLVNDMKIPEDSNAAPPFDYVMTKSVYSGKMEKKGTRISARFQIQVLKKNAYIKIPLLYQNAALEDLKVDGGPALTVTEGGSHQLLLSKQGEHTAEAVFTLKTDLAQGPHRFDLSIHPTPITLFRLEMPFRDIDVEIPQAQYMTTEATGAGTVVSAVLSSSGTFSVAWRKKVTVQEKLPPKVYAEVDHLLSIEEDALRINSDVVFSILHSEVDEVSFIVPNDWNVLGVSGEGVGAWQEKMQNGQHRIFVPFTYGRQGSVIVNVQAEKPISDKGAANVFTGFQVPNVVRETGYIGVALNTSAEVKAVESTGLERAAVQKLPSLLYNKSAKPLILAYKYLRHPFALVLDVEKHEKIAVPMASVVSANVVTLFTEDGKVVHRLMYQLRNSEKQFLEVRIPKGADVWSVFVGNEPVESSLGSDGNLMVPLVRSRYSGSRLETFPVEILYCLSENPFRLFGRRGADLPPVDVMTSQVYWSVYVPNDYAYLYFKSTLEKEEIIRGVNLMGTRKRMLSIDKAAPAVGNVRDSGRLEESAKEAYKGKDYKSEFRNVPVQQEQAMQQLDAEMNFGNKMDELSQTAPQSAVSGGAAGILPIQIEVPTTGQVYRFAKTIVKPEDDLNAGIWYVRRGLVSFIRWIVLFVILLAGYRLRKTLRRGFDSLAGLWKKMEPGMKKADISITRMLKSKGLIAVLVILSILFAFLSRGLLFLTLMILWIILIYQVVVHFKEKKKEKTGLSGRKKK